MNHFLKMTARVFLGFLFCCQVALAHTDLETSLPTDGAVLTQAPTEFELSFTEEVRLLSAVLVDADGEETRLQPPRGGAAAHFVMEAPQMTTGDHSLEWTALGSDGHTLTGTLSFRIHE